MQAAGTAAFVLHNARTWTWWHYVLWLVMTVGALEMLNVGVLALPRAFGYREVIPPRGKHLDRLTKLDYAYIAINKAITAIFTYQLLAFLWTAPAVVWSLSSLTLLNGLLPLGLLFIVYDFFYTPFHRLLHVRTLYGAVHKHHHRQMAPTRGNTDAINESPIEMTIGEYFHLLAVWLLAEFWPWGLHLLSVLTFVVLGGVLASLNHTRFDMACPLLPSLWSVKVHDVHHFYPSANFGQYTMFWDWIFGSYKPWLQPAASGNEQHER